jgi:hypothetical protein
MSSAPAERVMDDLQRVAIEAACSRLVAQYAQLADLAEPGAAAELFLDDGVWELAGTRLAGREAIRSNSVAGRQQFAGRVTRHVCANVVITALDEERAEGTTYFLFFASDAATGDPLHFGAPSTIGVYRDRFIRAAEGWRIAHRRVELPAP